MKRLSSFFLLCALIALIFSGMGQLVMDEVSIEHAHAEALDRISEGRAGLSFKIDAEELVKSKACFLGDGEVSYNGHIYDIVSQTPKGTKVIFVLVGDEEEEYLIASLCQHISDLFEDDRDNKKSQNKVSPFEKDYFCHSYELFIRYPFMTKGLSVVYSVHIPLPVSPEILSPPPQV